MIRAFSYFNDWFKQHGMNPAAYKIVIIPQSVDAEARLKYRFTCDMQNISMDREPPEDFYRGFIAMIPFEIRGAE